MNIGNIKIRPSGNMVLCRCVASKPTMTPGGLHLLDAYGGRHNHAEVLAVGRGKVSKKGVRIPVSVEEKEKVLFDAYQIVWVEGQTRAVNSPVATPGDLFLIHDNNLLGVFDA